MRHKRHIPYGYTVRDGRTVIYNQEAEVIREIFKAYLTGASLKDIAEELTSRQIPYAEKCVTWDKSRVARIIDNAKYVGTEEYDPIVDDKIYEAAASLKVARLRNTYQKENEAIGLLRRFVRCERCGEKMKRRIDSRLLIKESWHCTNAECGAKVRISDARLIETLTILINRIILNSQLIQPKNNTRYEPDAKVKRAGNEIAMELEKDNPNEDYLIAKTVEMASFMYGQCNTKLNLAASIARKMIQTMAIQDEFNADYFTSLASYVALGEQGRVVLHTKTETEVTVDEGSNQNPEENNYRHRAATITDSR